ncbi:hypothetical protein [Streptomyces sp. RKCA744]|uniref:hypothetical protein n=1 Tax=Streptomyces sp. RKCA744 TaxID=2959340 RepID=UPI00209E79E6|nr:hypothetical protein [Streptomyces sp. RKCA744]MCO8308892.1 hypothetical protein [Streptomyces sp. RKCA744]
MSAEVEIPPNLIVMDVDAAVDHCGTQRGMGRGSQLGDYPMQFCGSLLATLDDGSKVAGEAETEPSNSAPPIRFGKRS